MSFDQMYAGDSKRLVFSIFDKEQLPLDMTGVEIRWQASRGTSEKFSKTPAIVKTLGDGIDDVALFDGQFIVHLHPEDTEELHGPYYHEVEIKSSSGDVSTAFSGQFTIMKNLIRPPG